VSHLIAVAANKGGSGKTTTAVNLAGALAGAGRRVVVVDADPQGAATVSLGVVPRSPALYEVLVGAVASVEALTQSGTPGVRVLPATLDLAGAELELPARDPNGWRDALRRRLEPLAGQADVVIIDTPPGLAPLSFMAVKAADQVLVACPSDFLSVRSLPAVFETVERAGVELIGIVPTKVEGRTRHEADFLAYLRETYPKQLLSPIPRRVVIRDAMASGQPVATYAPSSDAAAAFDTLAQEVTRVAQTS
jgi:chromosome partitioning protein